MNNQATASKNDFNVAQNKKKSIIKNRSHLEHELNELDEKYEELQKTMHNGKVIENLVCFLIN